MARDKHQSCFKWPILTVTLTLLIRLPSIAAMPCTTIKSSTGSHVQCSHHRMTRFPVHLPDDVAWLDLSYNFLTSLDALRKPTFSKLQHLFLSHNSITHLENNTFKALINLRTLDLGNNNISTLNSGILSGFPNLTNLRLSSVGLHTVPADLFQSVNHLLSLDLSDNSLSRIPSAALQYVSSLQYLDMRINPLSTIHNHSLSSMSSLQHLVLQSNQLTSLQPAAFVGLEKLTTLDLRFNQLKFEFSYPEGVFSPLVSLDTLDLRGNDQVSSEYPLKVFDSISPLKTLSIDLLSFATFETAFANLSLKTLNMGLPLNGHVCAVKHISNKTFAAFHRSGLQTLSFNTCYLIRIDVCAFCSLPQLTHLTMQTVYDIRLSSLLLALYGLQGQTLETLHFVGVNYFGPTILDSSVTRYLNNMCVKSLSLRDSAVAGLSPTAFMFKGRLLKCLKHFDVSQNSISHWVTSTYMKLVIGLINVESIQLADQRAFARGIKAHKHRKLQQTNKRGNTTAYIPTAPSLTNFNASSGIRDVSQLPEYVYFSHGDNLSILDISFCGIMNCNFTVIGLTSIHTFDLSGNDCYVTGSQLVQHMPTLRRLLLADVYLQEQFLFTSGTLMLQPLTLLEELDLSNNQLSTLPADLLKHQPGLKRLALVGNRLKNLPLDISLHPSLQDLDLRDNMIHTLSPSERHILDSLADNHTFTLRLRGNPLRCTCQALDMVSWLATTTVRLDGDNKNDGFDDDYDDNGRDYPCVLEDGSVSSTWQVMVSWESHWRHCVGLSFFTVALVAQLLQMLAVLIAYLLWNKWTFIRHKWHVLRHVHLPFRADFEHDALLVYASDEHGMAARMKAILTDLRPGLRLALQEDEIPLGRFPPDIILEAMDRSWKIIVLVTQDFMEDDLSGYTVLHVQAKISDVMPNRVLLLYVGDLRPGDMDGPAPLFLRRLLHVLPESHVCHVPRDIVGHLDHPVWEFVIEKILHDE